MDNLTHSPKDGGLTVEGRAEPTNRLRRENLWATASGYKDQVIAKLRGEGVPRIEAQERGWQAMAERYPPIEQADQDVEDPASFGDGSEADFDIAAPDH